MPYLSRNSLKSILKAWEAAGLDPKPIAPYVHEAEQLLSRLDEQRTACLAPSNRDDVVDQLARGDIDLIEAYRFEQSSGVATPEQKERIHRLHRDASARVLRRSQQALLSEPDALIADHLGPAHETIVEQVAKLAPAVVGINSDADAVSAPAKAREAWGKLHDLNARRAALLTVLRTFGAGGLLVPMPKGVHSSFRTLARPHLKPYGIGAFHPIQRLAMLISADAGPGIYTTEQAIAHAKAAPRLDEEEPAPTATEQWLASLGRAYVD